MMYQIMKGLECHAKGLYMDNEFENTKAPQVLSPQSGFTVCSAGPCHARHSV